MMRRLMSAAGWVSTAVLLAAGCTALPAVGSTPAATSSTTAVTSAPAATAAPGSTEAPASTEVLVTEAPSAEPAITSVGATATPPQSQQPTTAPEPTLPPARTAPGQPAATALAPAPAPAAATEAAAAQIACTPGSLTPSQTEGPYYKANPPEANDLLQPGMGGTQLTITGYVLDEACQPVPGARVDFWQADSEGQYDNQGYTLRGYQVTDAQGRYLVETVVPGLYPGRTRHIHVKVSAPNGPVLTTQLYFPGESSNQSDQIFSPVLVMSVVKTGDVETGTFNFVINTK